MHKKIIPALLAVALLASAFLSIFSIYNMQGNARVINYTGVVRGATQRLIKQEISGITNDGLIARLDGIIEELLTGKGDNGLILLKSEQYHELMSRLQADWKDIKSEILLVRGGKDSQHLFTLSESFFDLADQAVSTAEEFSEHSVLEAEKWLCYLTLSVIGVSLLIGLYGSRQTKRHQSLKAAEKANQKQRQQLSQMSEDLRAPLNEISELMYVADPQTYDLLFINEAGRKTFQIADVAGQKCYKVLQGLDAPCSFCTNPLLKEGENYTWEFTNPLTKRHYLLKDRLIQWEGRTARLEIAFDTTDSENERLALEFTLEAEKMIVECIRILYQSRAHKDSVYQVLELLCRFLCAERVYLLSYEDGFLKRGAEWRSDHIISKDIQCEEFPSAVISHWQNAFSSKGCVIIEDVELLGQAFPMEYQWLRERVIHSLSAAPLEQDGQLCGCLCVINPPPDRMTNLEPLLQTLCYFLILAHRRSEMEQQLSRLSYHDTLTSFFNRNRYIEDSRQLSSLDIPVGIAFLDVNGLKDINDLHGHSFGDEILVRCAAHMRSVFGNDCSYYRIGGDEFVMICRDVKQDEFEDNVRRLKTVFSQDPICNAAIGGQWTPHSAEINRMISLADADMYEDKKEFYRIHPTSNRYRHHSDEVLHLADPGVLKDELANNQFVVYLQPKISAADRSTIGAEALIRYRTQNNSLMLPGNFLPLLNEAQSISQVDFFVFEFVCSKIQEWVKQGKQALPVSVNFSRCSLAQPSFVDTLSSICDKYQLSPHYLEIELTGTLNREEDMEGLDLKDLIGKLREAGFTVALDDFGTEHASLSLLSDIKFDIVKLDKSMIKDIAHNRRAQAIVESIAAVCQKMDIKLVAEGIESEEQLAALRLRGVELAQGYLFSHPIPIEEYEREFLH